MFVSDLWQVCGFLPALVVPPPIKLAVTISGADSGGAHPARPPPPKIGKKMIFLAQNRDFSHEIPQIFRAPPPNIGKI